MIINISIENCYLVKKQNKENFVKKNRRFVDSRIVKICDELDHRLVIVLINNLFKVSFKSFKDQ